MFILTDEQMLKKVFCSNYFQLECTTNLKLAFLSCILKALSRDTPLTNLSCHLAKSTCYLEIQLPGVATWHLVHHQNLASGVSLKRAFKMQVASALQSKVMA